MRLIWYNRDKFSDQDIAQAKAVANRLVNKKEVDPPLSPFFGGSTMRVPFQYGNSGNTTNNTPRQTPVMTGKKRTTEP